MTDWLKNNAWALVIALMTLVSTYTLYGYRLDRLEAQTHDNTVAISTITTNVDKNNLQTQVALAKIQTDIEYIKTQLNKLVP